jgi:hypothetical protein
MDKNGKYVFEISEFKDPSLGQGMSKTDKTTKLMVFGIKQSFPDLHDQVIQIYPSGDKHIIVEFVLVDTAPDNSNLSCQSAPFDN